MPPYLPQAACSVDSTTWDVSMALSCQRASRVRRAMPPWSYCKTATRIKTFSTRADESTVKRHGANSEAPGHGNQADAKLSELPGEVILLPAVEQVAVLPMLGGLMTMGGSGFGTLVKRVNGNNHRLAYMRCHYSYSDESGPRSKFRDRFAFYEMYSPEIWEGFGEGTGLLSGFHDGSITLRQVVKSPSGGMRVRRFDVRQAQIEIMMDGQYFTFGNGILLPRVLRITNSDGSSLDNVIE